jgi:hypothetical protein
MQHLARYSAGRIVLHLLAMVGDHCIRFHLDGVIRELSSLSTVLPVAVRSCLVHEREAASRLSSVLPRLRQRREFWR